MSSSRRTRRQQKSLHRHQLRLEGLEKRYALSAGWLSRTELINTAENFPITQAVVLDINQDSWTDLIVAQTDFSGPSTPDPDGPPGSTITNGQPGWISLFENRQGTLVYVGREQATAVNPLASSRGLIESSGAGALGSGIGLGSTRPELALASGEIWSFGSGVGGTAYSFQKTSGASNSLVEGNFHGVIDLDGDSHNEWLSTIGGGAQPLLMSVQRNQGNGSFSSSTSTNFGVNCLGSYLVDFDSDGLVDALAVRKTEDATAGQWAEVKLEFWRGVSNGTQFSYARDLLAPKPQSMFPTEMNGDGYIDVVSFINGGQDIEIYLGTPDHALGEPTVLSTGNSADHYTGAYLSWVGGPDLNNDGLYDVLFADGRYIQKFIFGDAHGNFQVRDPHGDGWGNQPFHAIAGADFDKDGLFEAISITNQSDLRSGENRNWISEFGYFGSELDATPSTPRDLQVVAGVSEASLSWDAPISGGSSTVTGYV
ncbi:MAG: FG-GAP repeat domain-containing protein, partial [Pirellulales bacterium]